LSDVKVNFAHPTDGRILTVTVDSNITAQEAVAELIASDFIKPNPKGYMLAIKGGRQIASNESFAKAKVVENDSIRIIPATDAGGIQGKPKDTKKEKRTYEPAEEDKSQKYERSGIPGLEVNSSDRFTILDIQNSPEALIMIVNMYDDLKIKYEEKSKDFEIEKLKSNNRFVSTLLLLISQVILAIGSNLLTANKSIAIPVLLAGIIQASLALYLAFKKPSM